MKSEVGLWAWHVHHGRLVERLTEPLAERQAYIRANKPPEERALRLRLLRVVRAQHVLETFDAATRKACAAYDAAMRKACAAYATATRKALATAMRKPWAAYDAAMREAREVYDAAVRAAWAPVEQLHREECPDCPWDGTTIFPVRR